MENNNVNEVNLTETKIKKKKSFIPIIVAFIVVIIVGVIVYFSFFSEAAVRDREIKAHIASAEKYLDDLDYEKALAEYEAIFKLDPSREDVLDDYTETALAWSEDVADDDLEKAIEILEDTIKFLEKNATEESSNEARIELLRSKKESYISNLNNSNDETDIEGTDSVEIVEPVATYTSEIIDVDGIAGDSWWWKVTPESIVCFDYIDYDPSGTMDKNDEYYYVDCCYKVTMRIYDFDGNLINEVLFDDNIETPSGYSSVVCNFSAYVSDYYHNKTGIIVSINNGGGYSIYTYDFLGDLNDLIFLDDTAYSAIVNGFGISFKAPLHFNDTVENSYLAVTLSEEIYSSPYNYYSGPVVPVLYLNCETMTFENVYEWNYDNDSLIKNEEIADHEMISAPEYDEEQFLYCSELKDVNSEAKYLIETIDEQWGYADKDFNILALYEDASGFNIYGYALVSDDRENYDLIDSDFNVVEEDFAHGDSAWTNGSCVILGVQNGDDQTFYLVKGEED